jgi:hypothetical protein
MQEPNYTKREHDAFRAENRLQHETVMNFLEELRGEIKLDKDLTTKLYTVVSDNSGAIAELQKAHKLIKDITTVWTAGKWFVYFIIGTSALIVSIKTILSAGIQEGLAKLKDIIF